MVKRLARWLRNKVLCRVCTQEYEYDQVPDTPDPEAEFETPYPDRELRVNGNSELPVTPKNKKEGTTMAKTKQTMVQGKGKGRGKAKKVDKLVVTKAKERQIKAGGAVPQKSAEGSIETRSELAKVANQPEDLTPEEQDNSPQHRGELSDTSPNGESIAVVRAPVFVRRALPPITRKPPRISRRVARIR